MPTTSPMESMAPSAASRLTSTDLQDNVKKLEYKNLIKDKVLKPSKIAKFDYVRGHHAHLVIRDSHYLIKSPTSFITCASCHRGRVLKISTISELSTEQLLDEVYTTISKNPCSKRKNTAKEHQVLTEAQKRQRLLPTTDSMKKSVLDPLNFGSRHSMIKSGNSSSSSAAPSLMATSVSSYPLPPTSSLSAPSQTAPISYEVPLFDDFFNDFEPLQNIPQVHQSLEIASTGSSMKVSSFTLTSLFNAQSNFPANLDIFLSQAMEEHFGSNFFTQDTLFVPLPTYSCTLFSKDNNKSHFLRDDIFQRKLQSRVHDFVNQPNVNLNNLRVIILFNYFQEGVPDRPQENQSHKYVGNVYVLHSFSVLADSSLSFSNLRYSFNHNYTWVDSKEEATKNSLFTDLILSKLQNEVFMKTNEVPLGTHVNPLVIERAALMTVIPFTTEETFVLSSSGSLFVVCFIALKLLRILMADEGLQMIGYVSTVQFNSKFHIYLLKIMLEHLRRNQETKSIYRSSEF